MPTMDQELRELIRIIDRDDVEANRTTRFSGECVLVFITRKKIIRLKALLKEGSVGRDTDPEYQAEIWDGRDPCPYHPTRPLETCTACDPSKGHNLKPR